MNAYDGGSEQRDALLWTAFQYVGDELPADESQLFEARLATDQASREALAEEVAPGVFERRAEVAQEGKDDQDHERAAEKRRIDAGIAQGKQLVSGLEGEIQQLIAEEAARLGLVP